MHEGDEGFGETISHDSFFDHPRSREGEGVESGHKHRY